MIRTFRSCAVVLLIVALGVSACGKKKPATPAPAPAPPPAPAPAPTTPAPPPPPPPAAKPTETPRPPTEEEIFSRTSLADLNAQKPLGDVLFALDSTELSEQGRGTLQKNADWMKRWTSTKVVVEGQADSRGTNEYNLALGERRALAAKNYLVSLGIPADRIKTVSYGKEFPFDPGHDDSAWKNNRRAHFVITAK